VLTSRSFFERVRGDFISGVRSGVNGTPTFFLDGFRYEQAVTLPSLQRAIQETAAREAEGPA
jgi:predicted DsbA family dithiol-disulfide isomerase